MRNVVVEIRVTNDVVSSIVVTVAVSVVGDAETEISVVVTVSVVGDAEIEISVVVTVSVNVDKTTVVSEDGSRAASSWVSSVLPKFPPEYLLDRRSFSTSLGDRVRFTMRI
ncbi:hypothetical protein AAE478_001576 [Parahypoxylon ruwenzoriense]